MGNRVQIEETNNKFMGLKWTIKVITLNVNAWRKSKMVEAFAPSHGHTGSNYSYKTSEHWMNTFWQQTERDWIGKTRKPREPSHSCRNSQGPEEPGSTVACLWLTHPLWKGLQKLCSGALAYPARSPSVFTATMPGAFCFLTKRTTRNYRASPVATWFPFWELLLASRC